MNEDILIEHLINGSEKAFDEIYKIYSAKLFSFCYSYVKSRELAEEICSDVFIKLWLKKESIQNKKTVAPLLFTIARNSLINNYRSTLNAPIYEEYIGYCNHKELSIDSTSQLIEYDDFYKQVKTAMKKLSPTQCSVWECCKLQDLSNKETAKVLNLSEQSVKNQLSLSLKIMRKELNMYTWCLVVYILGEL